MYLRVLPFAVATGLAFAPIAAQPQELGVVSAPTAAIVLPSAPPMLSPDCRTKRVAGDLFRRPLRSMRRAVASKAHVKVLAIGSSSTVGIGASSPTATYVARLGNSLEGAF